MNFATILQNHFQWHLNPNVEVYDQEGSIVFVGMDSKNVCMAKKHQARFIQKCLNGNCDWSQIVNEFEESAQEILSMLSILYAMKMIEFVTINNIDLSTYLKSVPENFYILETNELLEAYAAPWLGLCFFQPCTGGDQICHDGNIYECTAAEDQLCSTGMACTPVLTF
jgi:hypothetical protein